MIKFITNLFSKKVMGCKGINCPIKDKCKKHYDFINQDYTTFYNNTPYNHMQKECISFEEL